ncbi:probable E3 ubiquitin-protein ligase HECTD2, partial [Engraulis encrasicolus]|uniref:probable E3 ubiquitin-protein ligase HECTD2 n=1 Tax=Engraulis encrasicolus TaxID=184585 RepID=UPI002FD75403
MFPFVDIPNPGGHGKENGLRFPFFQNCSLYIHNLHVQAKFGSVFRFRSQVYGRLVCIWLIIVYICRLSPSSVQQTLVDKVSRRQRVDMSLLFLNIKVRRLQLVSDSLDELARKRADLKKKLKVTFVGEAGLDMGGLTKEWFLLLIRQIFHTDYGMFTYIKESQYHWFSSWNCDNCSEFRLVGSLMGLALYNSITLDIRFPPCVYKKLLNPPMVPCDPDAPVGITPLTLEDLQQVMPDLAHGLSELLSYEGNVEEDYYTTFQVFQEEMGVIKSYNLKPGGDKIPLTNHNRKEYVQLYIDFLLNKSIEKPFAAFYHGFHSVCASDAIMLLRPEEIEVLVCGSPHLDMVSLQRVAQYEGFSKTDPTIRYVHAHVSSPSLLIFFHQLSSLTLSSTRGSLLLQTTPLS